MLKQQAHVSSWLELPLRGNKDTRTSICLTPSCAEILISLVNRAGHGRQAGSMARWQVAWSRRSGRGPSPVPATCGGVTRPAPGPCNPSHSPAALHANTPVSLQPPGQSSHSLLALQAPQTRPSHPPWKKPLFPCLCGPPEKPSAHISPHEPPAHPTTFIQVSFPLDLGHSPPRKPRPAQASPVNPSPRGPTCLLHQLHSSASSLQLVLESLPSVLSTPSTL